MSGSSATSKITEGLITLTGDRPKPDQEAISNGVVVEHLGTSVFEAGGLKYASHYLRELLETQAWRHFADHYSWYLFEYREDEFDKFARARTPAGLGLEKEGVAALLRICHASKGEDAEVALQLMRELLPPVIEAGRAGPGRGKKTVDNINRFPKGGTSEAYLLRRLKRDRPELAARVVSGELTPHRAAIEAGIRTRLAQCPATVEGFWRAIQKHLSKEQRKLLARRLLEKRP